MGKQLRIPSGYTKVTTRVQAKFHLDNNEILALPINVLKSMYIKKNLDVEGTFELAMIPLVGKAVIYVGELKDVYELIDRYEFYLIRGASLRPKDPHVLDRVVDWFSRIFVKDGA